MIGAVLFHVLGVRDYTVHHDLDALVYALLLAGPLALLWRRRAPIAVFAVAASGSIAFASIASPHWSYAVAPVIALYSVSCGGRHRVAAVAGGSAYAAYLLVTLVLMERIGLPGTPPGLRESLLLGAAVAGAVLAGVVARSYGEQVAAITKVREEQDRARAEQERRQASEERLRIARELHDVLGHHLSLINVQAGVGLHLMDSRPEQAREALSAIKTASAEALREVRSVLGVLRTEGEAAPRKPALGLNRLEELTADAGFPVRTVVKGEPRELPAEVDRAAYRIVQEALTNVRRHAGPSPDAVVTINYLPSALHFSIRNDGPATDPPTSPLTDPSTNQGADPATDQSATRERSSLRDPPRDASRDGLRDGPRGVDPGVGGPGEGGSGIAGMRARAESLGGRFAAGMLAEGGFLVSVVLPVGSQE
ncbi:two-component sensor histidine kinase [Actinoplanes sp. OR16]|nr:two-component sensor histidine kinase [Actinoplanes sp. OR16]